MAPGSSWLSLPSASDTWQVGVNPPKEIFWVGTGSFVCLGSRKRGCLSTVCLFSSLSSSLCFTRNSSQPRLLRGWDKTREAKVSLSISLCLLWCLWQWQCLLQRLQLPLDSSFQHGLCSSQQLSVCFSSHLVLASSGLDNTTSS